jgi:hypothetical protein
MTQCLRAAPDEATSLALCTGLGTLAEVDIEVVPARQRTPTQVVRGSVARAMLAQPGGRVDTHGQRGIPDEATSPRERVP